jgi:hypothetical protein
MAEMKVFDLTFQDESGKVYDAQIEAPADASTADLQAAAAQYLATARPQTAFPAAIVKSAAPIPIPTKEEAAKQIAATSAQTAATKKAQGERGVLEAFTQGFMAPRREDPFGLQGLTPGEAQALPLVQLLNYAREGVQSLGSGLAEAGGQAVYNLGLGQGYSPQRIAAELGEFAQVGGLALPTSPLRAQAATTEFVLPSIRNALQTTRQAAVNVPNLDRLTPAQRLLAASERQNVPLIAADVGGPGVQGFTAGAGQSIMGRGPITRAAEATTEGLQLAAQRAADATGEVKSPFEIGLRLKDAAAAFSTATSRRGGQLYDRVRDQAEGLLFRPLNAAKTLDREIDFLRKKNDPTDPLLRYLEDKRTQLSSTGGFDYEGAKQILSDLKADHRVKDDLLRVTSAKETLGRVARAMEEDVTGTMIKNGKEGAANAFKTANAYWRQRVETLDDALQPILGPDATPERILDSVNAMARGGKGGVQRLVRVINSLPEDDRGSVRATIVDRLGRAKAGMQDVGGEVFSPAEFLTNWNKMSPEAKVALFGRDKKLTQSLNDIAVLADSTKQAQRFVNQSQTAGAANYANLFNVMAGAGALGGAGAAGAGNFGLALTATVLPLVLTKLSASALTSQRLVRYLANAPKTAKNADQFRAGLLDVASKTPAISAEIEAIVAEMEGR